MVYFFAAVGLKSLRFDKAVSERLTNRFVVETPLLSILNTKS
jgi:hypothetical protein